MTDELEAAIDRLITDSWDDLDEVLGRLTQSDVELNPAVSALLFGLLGGFAVGYMDAKNGDESFDVCINHALQNALSDPRVDSLIQMTITDAVDNKVGELIDG
tara:strand:- start:94 stop:402 length:309 start_codon:yes stop_codon:yes gene_type:complete